MRDSQNYRAMKKLILFMHVSLDGFVAGPNGEMDWIRVDEEIFDYAARLTDHSDTALYGRITYEMMNAYWPTAGEQPEASKHDKHHSRWYNSVAKVVISNSMKSHEITNTKIIGSENLLEEIQAVKRHGDMNIAIFGSPSASHALMRQGLIDEYWLFINPVLLGAGIPLFRDIRQKMDLKLEESKVFASGVIGAHYTTVSDLYKSQ